MYWKDLYCGRYRDVQVRQRERAGVGTEVISVPVRMLVLLRRLNGRGSGERCERGLEVIAEEKHLVSQGCGI